MTHNLPPLSFNRRMTFCELRDALWLYDEAGTCVSSVPNGFLSDGASVPRWAQWLIGRWGPHLWAALWHDWAYYMASKGMPICTRREADERLFTVARADGMHLRTAVVMWLAVRLCGRKYWRPR